MRSSISILLIISLLFLKSAGLAETNKIDSLKKVLSKLANTARIERLYALGGECLCERNESTGYCTNTLYEESKKVNYIHGIAEAYFGQAIVTKHREDHFHSEQLARSAVSCYDRTPNKKEIEYPYQQVASELFGQKEKGHREMKLNLNEEILFRNITDDFIGRKHVAELKSKSASTHQSMGMRINANLIAMIQQQNQSSTYIKIKDLVLADGSDGGTEVLLEIPAMR